MLPTAKSRPLVPRLRFPEFRDAGEWKENQLGEVGEFMGGGTPSKSNDSFWKGSIPWVSSSDISEDSIHDIRINRFITDEALENSATKRVPENSILLVSRVGVGKLAIAKTSVCTSQDFTNFTPYSDDLEFLAYSIKGNSRALEALGQGMAIKGFTKEDVSKLKISLPSLEEQQKIADCLSSLDALIAAQAEKIDALKTHKKGLMQQLFPREGETIPRLRFSEFRDGGEWVVKPLGKILSIGNGRDHKHLPDGDIPVYGSGGYMRSVNDYLYDGESVCIGRKGTIDKPIFLDGKFWTVDTLFYTHSFKSAVPKFVFALFQNIEWLKHNEAGGVPSLSKTNIEKIEVEIPGLKEQQQIADCLSSLDALITAQGEKLDTLKTHKKGLMQQLFPAVEAVGA